MEVSPYSEVNVLVKGKLCVQGPSFTVGISM